MSKKKQKQNVVAVGGVVCLAIGSILDRILFLYVYLPDSQWEADQIVAFNEFICFYTEPIGWIGLFFICCGLCLLLIPLST